MDYLKMKYAGYKRVDCRFLQDELLLSQDEYRAVRQDVANALGKTRCPPALDLDVFCDAISAYLE